MTAKQVFTGVKVVDFTWAATGPQINRELAEHGATVVRVESHRRPDIFRVAPPFRDGKPGFNRSAYYATYNNDKLGMTLDLSKPKGKEVGLRLALWADIVTDSMTPGTMKRWGLDYDSLKVHKPDTIMYSTTQQGHHGPYSPFGSYGWAAAAMSGFHVLAGWPDRGPAYLYEAYNDYVAPWYMIITLIAALDYRRRTGKGLFLEQSQIEAGVNFLGPAVLDYAVNGKIASRAGNLDPNMAPHGAYPCLSLSGKDLGRDRWCTIAVRTDEEWQALCRAMGDPEWTQSPKFATLLSRKENEEELDRLIGEWTKDYTAEQAMAALQAAGVPAGVILTSEDLFKDAQFKHRQHYRLLPHKVIGPHHYQAPAYKLSKTPAHIWRPGPCMGEDNEYVYKELLGFSDSEVADLLAEGVITTDADVPPGF